MTPESVVEIGQYAMKTVVLVAGPMLLAGMVVGLVISIFQAATQINEMTMTFVPKILAVFVVLIITLPWTIQQMTAFTEAMFNRIANM
ncbi:MAG: flagellar biosynthesis protein FliQ [bacterium]|jgi:flagellar biosynthetic protein FliQ|nr:flagellar biosynthesis protein FliQ [bacterium]MBK7045991.1 flagellar biosynthesis protein FliQ [bacterium]MBK7189289.1 flagellar biosynthesis protein FliQ [bacterium]MBK7671624.1 flagellar biosynthesis protein FliQ [bacterium]MBK7770686.1 flagellar biosynthesis protein FliQ [bacterium]